MNSQLLFTRPAFWLFMLVVLAILSLLKKKTGMRNAFLFSASIFFYWNTSASFVFLLLFSTTADWLIALAMSKSNSWKRKAWLVLSIVINLGLLGFFKYAYFFADASSALFGTTWEAIIPGANWMNSNLGTSFRVDSILLPVGISFYTFQTLSYAIDVYRKDIEPVKSFRDFGCYVTFFPQLVAGPIVRAKSFIPQLRAPYNLTQKEFKMGIWLILTGLIKKIILADYIATNLVDRVFLNPTSYSGMEVVIGLYGYSLQVFADFSGYSDIAIGVALIMGFRLAENFRSPYKARNVGEFWERWHISLSTWLKDYLYIPMGGSRRSSYFTWIFSISVIAFIAKMLGVDGGINMGVLFLGMGLMLLIWSSGVMFPKWGLKVATYVNIMATMVIGGLWHGASWNFLLWGALNGAGLLLYKIVGKHLPWASRDKFWARAIGVFTTFNFITFTRIWFRAGSGIGWETVPGNHNLLTEWFTANDLLYQIYHHFFDIPAQAIARGHFICISLMILGFVVHLAPEKIKKNIIELFTSLKLISVWAICAVVALVLWKVQGADPSPFIYFQF
ncbi:MAG: membrane-bound O-acyltransferase family protein [Bacteroidetes bacterium]|nr:MAG: membrane-bound O-acyltransferase family protein [Bacteroidota bacterium]